MDASVGIALTQVKASGRLSIHRDIVGNSVLREAVARHVEFFARSLSADGNARANVRLGTARNFAGNSRSITRSPSAVVRMIGRSPFPFVRMLSGNSVPSDRFRLSHELSGSEPEQAD